MEEIKPTADGIFSSFGVGSLFLALVFLLFGIPEAGISKVFELQASELPDALWIPISAMFIFLLHTFGRLAIFVGQMFGYSVRIGGLYSHEIYAKLMIKDNPWLWRRYQESEQNSNLVWGLLGICVLILLLFIVGFASHLMGFSKQLPFSFSTASFLFFSLCTLTLSLKMASLDLDHLIKSHELAILKAEIESSTQSCDSSATSTTVGP